MNHLFIKLAVGFITLASSGYTYATCSLINNASAGMVTISFADYQADPGDSNAKVQQTRSFTANELAAAMGLGRRITIYRCTANENLIWGQGAFPTIPGPSPENTGYINIGIPNLYIYLTAEQGTATGILTPLPSGADYRRSSGTFNNGSGSWNDIGNIRVTLYKKGRISQGGKVQGNILNKWITEDGVLMLTFMLAPFEVKVKGCKVTTPNPEAILGDVHRTQFNGIGTTAGSATFDINLDCDSAISPTVTFSGTPAIVGKSNVLALNNSATAKGVGVQILYKNKEVLLNTPISLGKTLAQGIVKSTFSARYYQISNTITGGDATATAQFTINYE